MIAFTFPSGLGSASDKLPPAARRENCHAFTLIELMAVVSIIGIMSALASTAISSAEASGDFNQAVGEVSGVLDQARSYAIAKNTFVYVGFTEVDNSPAAAASPATGNGRVVVVAMASRDGSRGFDVNSADPSGSWSSNYNGGSNLLLIGKPLYVNNVHLPAQQETATGNMARPTLSSASDLIGSSGSTSATPLALPLGSPLNGGKYNFNRVVYFDPQGTVHLQSATADSTGIDPYLEVDLQPVHGDAVPTVASSNLAAIQVDGMTGSLRVYRP